MIELLIYYPYTSHIIQAIASKNFQFITHTQTKIQNTTMILFNICLIFTIKVY